MAGPLVSICIPTFNGAQWIREAIRSALAQTYAPFEVLVLDDASTDDTVAQVRSLKDERLRVEVNERNLGLVGNWNQCVQRARGSLIKFLFQDDILYPECLQRMVSIFQAHERVGLVFARRDILLEDPADPRAIAWKNRFGSLHHQFEAIQAVNTGRDLFEQYLRKGFCGNWIGEPSSVMLRKECFQRLGLFNTRMRQDSDYEMWIRVMYYYDVGFIEAPLSGFRFHSRSTGSRNTESRRAWLDWLWLLEGLLSHEEIARSYPEIKRLRLAVAVQLARQEWAQLRQRRPMAPLYQARTLMEYLLYRTRQLVPRAPSVQRSWQPGTPVSTPSARTPSRRSARGGRA